MQVIHKLKSKFKIAISLFPLSKYYLKIYCDKLFMNKQFVPEYLILFSQLQ